MQYFYINRLLANARIVYYPSNFDVCCSIGVHQNSYRCQLLSVYSTKFSEKFEMIYWLRISYKRKIYHISLATKIALLS
jgi:hypothetical protein